MNIAIVTPAPRGSRTGNRVTALRWAALLRQLGHRVTLGTAYTAERPCDVLVALHARRSADAVSRAHAADPSRPIVVALAGTDLYQDLPHSPLAQRTLALAARLVVLQRCAIDALPAAMRPRARTILQSACAPSDPPARDERAYDVCVLGHLREVKDPLRTAYAARQLPPSSRVRVLQVGGAIEPGFAERAMDEARTNPRYVWRGELPRREAHRVLATCRLLVLTSRSEGGANVIAEALTCGVPVLATRIPGNIGMLDDDYPGYFPVADTDALASLLLRAEQDRAFASALREACERLRPRFAPAAEREAWRALLAELSP